MSSIYSDISIKNQEKENRLKRIKEAKDLDIYWSKQIAQANRENEEIRKQQEEYKGAVEQYKNILLMIEELKRNKELYIKRQAESEIENEKEKQRQYEEMLLAQEKKRKFEIFLKQKGVEASNYLKEMQEEKNRQHEELHRCEKKKQTKFEENLKTKKVIDNYIIKREKEINEEKMNASNPGTMDVLYTITNPFHNNGNKIDYSTTRFHNVTVERHDNNLPNTLDLKINAFERARVEAENTKKILNDKNNKLKEFKKNEKLNFREQINRNKAKQNMELLNNEIKEINKAKKGERKNAKKRIDINANINNAKQNEKKAEHIMNKLLENQKGNRGKIYGDKNNLQIITNNNSNNAQKISDDSLTNFYKDKNDVYDDINENEVFNNINIDDENQMDAPGNKNIKKYEEPIIRDRIPKKEVVNRLSPVDLPSYQKVELQENNDYEHKEPVVKNQIFILNKKQTKNNNKYYLEDLPKKTNDFNLLNELQLNNNISNNYNSGIMNNNEMNDVKMFINQINSDNFGNNNNSTSNQNNNNNININNTVNLNQKEIINYNNNNEIMNEKINEEQKDKKENKENRDKKWKYNKQELYERKKKMLKDKSNFK